MYGRKFTFPTDHRPLTTILGPHTGIPFYFRQVEKSPVSAVEVKTETRNDPEVSAVMDIVVKGQNTVNPYLRPFLKTKLELSVRSGYLLWDRRVIIPQSVCKKMLQQLHSGHSEIVRMKEIARSYFWWPNMDKQIEEMANSCSSCHKVRNNPPQASLHPWEYLQEPWKRIHINFAGPFEDKMFLVVVDAHSKWPEVAIMRSTTTEKTTEKLGEMFSCFGSPAQLVSDNGPELVSQEMTPFLQAMEYNTSDQLHTILQQMDWQKGLSKQRNMH